MAAATTTVRITENCTGGTWRPGTFTCPDASISNAAIGGEAIAADKIRRRYFRFLAIASTTTVTAVERYVTIPRTGTGALTIVAVKAMPFTAPTGGTRYFTVDLQHGSGTSYLAAPIVFSEADTDLTVKSAVIGTTSIALGNNPVKLLTTVSGTTGTQGIGLVVSLAVEDYP